MKNIIAALLKSQKEIKNALKDASNPHHKNKYATLESVIDATKEVANKNGIVIIQSPGKDEMGDFLKTDLMHESGEVLTSNVYLVLDRVNMQGMGSALTYARRYSLASMFCITQEDDDGSGTTSPEKNNKTITRTDASKFASTGPVRDISKFKVTFGNRYPGKMLCEINMKDLTEYVGFLSSNFQNPDGQMKEFIDTARQYIRDSV